MIPGVASSLASTIEPFEQQSFNPVDKSLQHNEVVSNTVVMEVTDKNLVQPYDRVWGTGPQN